MPDTLQRPRTSAVAAGASGRIPAQRRRTPAGRDWAPTPVMQPLVVRLPAPRVAPDAAERVTEPVPPRRRRGRRVVAAVLLNLLVLSSVGVFAALAIGPRTGHYQTLTMLTGSMRPQFPPGSVVVVTREPASSLRPGMVITFRAPTPDRQVFTHRVVSVDRSGAHPVVVTKGDANPGIDPWQAVIADPYVWQARFAVPLLGDAIRVLRQPEVQLVVTRVLPGMLLAWLLVSIWRSGDSRA